MMEKGDTFLKAAHISTDDLCNHKDSISQSCCRMVLKKLNYYSESIINIIAKELLKNGVWRENKLWVSLPASYFSKSFKITVRSVFNHVKKLTDEGILLKKQFRLFEGDPTNFYTIDLGVVFSEKFEHFFRSPIVKKLRTYINNNPHNQSNKKNGNAATVVMSKRKSADTPPSQKAKNTKPSTTIVQDMFKIWREEFGNNETLNKRLARWFVACYQQIFKGLDKWRKYVKKLQQSRYIMNKMRRCGYFLRWALSFKVIRKIYEGGFGVSEYFGECTNPFGEASTLGHEDNLESQKRHEVQTANCGHRSELWSQKRFGFPTATCSHKSDWEC